MLLSYLIKTQKNTKIYIQGVISFHCVGDLDPLVFNCVKHSTGRDQLYADIRNLKIQLPVNLLHLLALNDIRVNAVIIRFLKATV